MFTEWVLGAFSGFGSPGLDGQRRRLDKSSDVELQRAANAQMRLAEMYAKRNHQNGEPIVPMSHGVVIEGEYTSGEQ